MQVRRFKKLIPKDYIVQNCRTYLAIGSGYVHDLIAVDSQTLKVITSDIVQRNEPKFAEIIEAIEKLPRDVLKEIMTLDDEIENPLPVFMWRDNQIQETQTEDYEWPNVDSKGFLLYENTTFKTEKECVRYARRNMALFLQWVEELTAANIEKSQKILDCVKEYRRSDKYLSEIESKYEEVADR